MWRCRGFYHTHTHTASTMSGLKMSAEGYKQGKVRACGQFIACHQGRGFSRVWAPRPRSHERTGQWCDRWRTCHIQRCCRSPSLSIPWGSEVRMKMIDKRLAGSVLSIVNKAEAC